MALPSQMDRSGELGRPYMARGSKAAKNRAVVVGGTIVVIAAVVVLAYMVRTMQGRNTPSDTPGNQPPQMAGLGGTGRGANIADSPASKVDPSAAAPLRADSTSNGAQRPSPIDVTRPPADPAATPTANPAAIPQGPPPTTAIPASASTSEARSLIEAGEKALVQGNPVLARELLSRALLDPQTAKADQATLRAKLTTINDDLLFSTRITPNDTLVESYTVVGGDSLVRIAKRRQLTPDYRLIQRINRLGAPDKLQVGQKLKLVRGPFHAVVTKSAYRCDVFAGSPDEPERWLYIRSFPVGLGADDGTPIGSFVVKKNSKLINPHWTNPKTGEHFDANDPKNPIGENWIGIEGIGTSALHTGFGLHGTIEPSSIGQQKSMGCVRMHSDDIALVWELLAEQISVVKIVP